jgi:hypothetical protein
MSLLLFQLVSLTIVVGMVILVILYRVVIFRTSFNVREQIAFGNLDIVITVKIVRNIFSKTVKRELIAPGMRAV